MSERRLRCVLREDGDAMRRREIGIEDVVGGAVEDFVDLAPTEAAVAIDQGGLVGESCGSLGGEERHSGVRAWIGGAEGV